MTGLTAEQQFELRAKKALETGDASFKPRGHANKALFEKMKEEFDKKAKEINLHTSSVGDRIIKEITPLVTLFNGSDSTSPQDRINARILQNAANNKANKEDRVLIREQKEKAKAEAKGKAKAKAKKPAASSATASTAAPSEPMVESDHDEQCEDDDIYQVYLPEDDESSSEESDTLVVLEKLVAEGKAIKVKEAEERADAAMLGGDVLEAWQEFKAAANKKADITDRILNALLEEHQSIRVRLAKKAA